MSTVTVVAPSSVTVTPAVALPDGAAAVGPLGLPAPVDGADAMPTDALSRMIMMLTEQSAQSLTQTESQIREAQEKLEQNLDELMRALEAARAAAEQAARSRRKRKRGPFRRMFRRMMQKVGEALGKAAKAVLEVARDIVVVPAKATFEAMKHFGDLEKMIGSVVDQLGELAESSGRFDAVEQAVAGVVQAMGGVVEFYGEILASLATGDTSRLGEAFDGLAQDLKEHIWENEGLWEVAGDVAKVLAVTSAALTGGVLGAAAVALFAVMEIDRGTGVLDQVLSEKGAMGTRIGLNVAFAAASAGASLSSSGVEVGAERLDQATRILGGATSLANGGRSIHAGIQELRQARADAAVLRREADVEQVRNRMAQINRLIDDLIEQFGDDSDSKSRNERLSSKLVEGMNAVAEAPLNIRG